MFFKKAEPKCCSHACLYIALGMLTAFGVMALTKPGRKFIKNKMQCIGDKLDNCPALSS